MSGRPARRPRAPPAWSPRAEHPAWPSAAPLRGIDVFRRRSGIPGCIQRLLGQHHRWIRAPAPSRGGLPACHRGASRAVDGAGRVAPRCRRRAPHPNSPIRPYLRRALYRARRGTRGSRGRNCDGDDAGSSLDSHGRELNLAPSDAPPRGNPHALREGGSERAHPVGGRSGPGRSRRPIGSRGVTSLRGLRTAFPEWGPTA